MKVGDLVNNKTQTWPEGPRLVVGLHETAKSLIGILFEDEIRYVHYKHLEVIDDIGEGCKNGELKDEQLENVIGGMSTERFNLWRTEVLNESR